MNYINVRCYIRMLGGVTDEFGIPKMTRDEIDNCDKKFCMLHKSNTDNQFEIAQWDLPLKKPTVYDLRALVSKDDIRREKILLLKKEYNDHPIRLFSDKKLLKKLFPNLNEIIEDYIKEQLLYLDPAE